MKKLFLSACLALLTSVANAAGGVVSLGGSVTEIIYALGQGEQLIATDYSSLYPEEASELPQVGYYRAVGVEGLVSTMPTVVIASEKSGPKEALERLTELGIEVQLVSDQGTLDSLYERIAQVAQLLDAEEQGERLRQEVKTAVAEAMSLPSKPYRAALVINRTGTFQAAGGATSANELMRLAGFENIFIEQQSYKPISKESFLALQPEVIITTKASLETSGGLEQFKNDPTIANTPATTTGKIVVMDDLLALGMGPRVSEAIRLLRSVP